MKWTSHRSTGGIQSYKRSSDKLKRLSSNTLNQGLMNKKMKLKDTDTDAKVSAHPSGTVSAQTLTVPKMDFGSASNITINFNYNLPTSSYVGD